MYLVRVYRTGCRRIRPELLAQIPIDPKIAQMVDGGQVEYILRCHGLKKL